LFLQTAKRWKSGFLARIRKARPSMYMAFSKNNDGGISAYKIDSGRTPLHDLASILSRVELRQVHQD
jgi:hypothetical protein